MDSINDLLIGIKAELQRDRLNKILLIKESFILWQILIEGIDCANFSESDIEKLFKSNFGIYQQYFTDDSDYNFIMGWMMTLTFWFFGSEGSEDLGNSLLMKAYKSERSNSLFKWALRGELKLNGNEIANLKNDIYLRFDEFYDFGELIKEYFLDVIGPPDL